MGDVPANEQAPSWDWQRRLNALLEPMMKTNSEALARVTESYKASVAASIAAQQPGLEAQKALDAALLPQRQMRDMLESLSAPLAEQMAKIASNANTSADLGDWMIPLQQAVAAARIRWPDGMPLAPVDSGVLERLGSADWSDISNQLRDQPDVDLPAPPVIEPRQPLSRSDFLLIVSWLVAAAGLVAALGDGFQTTAGDMTAVASFLLACVSVADVIHPEPD